MSQWSDDLVNGFSSAMRTRRQQLGLSAQEVADRTETMGHPIGRSAIAAWENASRGDRMMLGDALVLAEALDMPLIETLSKFPSPNGYFPNRLQMEAGQIHRNGIETAIQRIANVARGQ